jgi:hypothetical protein
MSVPWAIVETSARHAGERGRTMTAIALERELDVEVEATWDGTADVADPLADPADPLADCVRVWCDYSAGPARVVGGFCDHCGARAHDDL